jgi:signal transduction histidine kinase
LKDYLVVFRYARFRESEPTYSRQQNFGKITVKTEYYYADDASIAYGRVPKGEYVKLTVADNGCGIPDDIMQNILDPVSQPRAPTRDMVPDLV